MTKLFLTGVIACFGFAFQAYAAGDMMNGPCAKDMQSLCSSAGTDRSAIHKCMMENEDKLSPECKAHHSKMKEMMKEVREVCHEDVEKFCGDVQPGKGRIMKCLKDHKDDLSQGCKDEMAKAKKSKHK